MNVQEILGDSDLLAPNAFSSTQKIGWLNQVQKQLYKEVPACFSTAPQDVREGQFTFVPRFPLEYHELLVFGIAKRMAERVQNFDLAQQLEVRYQNLLLDARTFTVPKVKKVTISRNWM